MARGFKTGGRQKGAVNKANAEALEAARATGILPLDYMLRVMRDDNADERRRDAMAIAAAAYCHQKLTPAQHSPSLVINGNGNAESVGILVRFVNPPKTINGHAE